MCHMSRIRAIIGYKFVNILCRMPFTKKFPNAGETIHIRVPKSYKDSVIALCVALDSKFLSDVSKGNSTIRKFIRNSLSE